MSCSLNLIVGFMPSLLSPSLEAIVDGFMDNEFGRVQGVEGSGMACQNDLEHGVFWQDAAARRGWGGGG